MLNGTMNSNWLPSAQGLRLDAVNEFWKRGLQSRKHIRGYSNNSGERLSVNQGRSNGLEGKGRFERALGHRAPRASAYVRSEYGHGSHAQVHVLEEKQASRRLLSVVKNIWFKMYIQAELPSKRLILSPETQGKSLGRKL